jgi:membrane protease YdiL (CAAX protease family)
MTADSSKESAPLGADLDQPLFQFGSQEDRLNAVVHSLVLLLAAFLVAGLFRQGVLGGLGLVGITESNASATVSVAEMAAQFAGFLATGIGYIKFQDSLSLVGIGRPSLRDLAVIAVGLVVLILSLTGLEQLFAQLGYEPAQNSAIAAGEGQPELYLYVIPVVVFLNSPGEELLFRGLVQGRFRQAYGVVPGILAAGAVFGLVHYLALVGSGSELVYVTIAATAGLLLGAVYEYTENLLVPIAIHALWNTSIYLLLYANATGAF